MPFVDKYKFPIYKLLTIKFIDISKSCASFKGVQCTWNCVCSIVIRYFYAGTWVGKSISHSSNSVLYFEKIYLPTYDSLSGHIWYTRVNILPSLLSTWKDCYYKVCNKSISNISRRSQNNRPRANNDNETKTRQRQEQKSLLGSAIANVICG